MSLASPDLLAFLLARVRPVGIGSVPLGQIHGRALAQAVRADRDSPACDVSAVDGYAVALADLERADVLPVAFDVPAGHCAPALPPGTCARVMTGAPLPAGAQAMVPREKTDETDPARIRFSAVPMFGANIRRQGENLGAGAAVLEAGREMTPAVAACLSVFGVPQAQVFRKLRLAVLITGDEVLCAGDAAAPHQVRDANGPALQGLLSPMPWVESVDVRFVKDESEALREAVDAALREADGVLLTGGVSAGDLDFVPKVLRDAGCEIVFHKMSIRPGKPLLGALTQDGKPVFGLPGNPVAVMTCARRFALPALRLRAGFAEAQPRYGCVEIQNPDAKTLDLTWFRPVKVLSCGKAQLIPTQGSGDPAGAARGDGFVEVPPGQTCAGWLPFFPW